MKIRNGFVSNSSSSSFTCQACGNTYSGWDSSPRDFDHQQCVRGHIFCEVINKEKFDELVEKGEEVDHDSLPEYFWEEPDYIEKYGLFGDDLYEIPSEFCSICQLQAVSSDDIISYLFKKTGTSKKDLEKEIKEKFGTYEELMKYIKE